MLLSEIATFLLVFSVAESVYPDGLTATVVDEIFLCDNYIMCEEKNDIVMKSFLDVMDGEPRQHMIESADKVFECPYNGEENYLAKFIKCWCLIEIPQRRRKMVDYGLEVYHRCGDNEESNDEYCESLNRAMDRVLDNLKTYQQDGKCPCLSDPAGNSPKSVPETGMDGMKFR